MSLSKQQFLKNSGWTFLELMLYPLLMIIATPLFIKKLGIEEYGLWMLVSTITLGVNVLNIGVGDTNIRLISKYRAEEKPQHIRKVFNFNFSFSLFLCLITLLVGTLFSQFSFIAIFYKTGDYTFANTVLFLACFSTGIKFVETSLLSVFKAFERFDISSKLLMLSKNSTMIINILLALLNYDLITIFVSSVLINALNVILQLVVLSRYRPGLIALPNFGILKEKRDHMNYNFWYWLQSVVALLGFLSDKLLVAYFTDVKTLGYYSIASTVGTSIHNFFLSFGSFIFPRVSYKLSLNKEITQLYYIARSFVAIPGWLLISGLLLFGDYIFRIWLGTETFEHSSIYIKLYLVYEAGMLLIIVPFYFINGSKRIRLNSLFEVVLRSSHILAMVIGFYLRGVEGLLYGLILGTFINIPFQYYQFHRKLLEPLISWQCILVLLPVLGIAGLIISGSLFFQVSLILGLCAITKLIYFDPTWKYFKERLSPGAIPSRSQVE